MWIFFQKFLILCLYHLLTIFVLNHAPNKRICLCTSVEQTIRFEIRTFQWLKVVYLKELCFKLYIEICIQPNIKYNKTKNTWNLYLNKSLKKNANIYIMYKNFQTYRYRVNHNEIHRFIHFLKLFISHSTLCVKDILAHFIH